MNSTEINQLLHELHGSLAHLPIQNSIAYEIILIAMLFHLRNEELSLKSLFTNVKSTEMGARYHLNRLTKDGWLDLKQSENDLRVKFVYPTAKLIQHYELFHRIRFSENKSI
jgi:DNA-binding MarR family transcriptional regulator